MAATFHLTEPYLFAVLQKSLKFYSDVNQRKMIIIIIFIIIIYHYYLTSKRSLAIKLKKLINIDEDITYTNNHSNAGSCIFKEIFLKNLTNTILISEYLSRLFYHALPTYHCLSIQSVCLGDRAAFR